MKVSSLFKYFFIAFAIGIIIYAGYTIYKNQNKNKENEVPEQVVAEENLIKDIRLSITNYDTINPLITNNKEILNISGLIYEPLFTLTNDYKLEPCLAKECSRTGDNIYVIKIDNNIKWQDGTFFLSKDIEFTINTLKQGNSIYKYNVEHITSTEIIDASTIKLTLDAQIPFFEYNLIFPIMSSTYYYDENFYETSKIPIGTGKYKISSITTNNITLEKNEKWRNLSSEDMKIENIKINLYSSMGEAYNSFKIGNIDLINTSNPNYQEYIGTIGFNKTDYSGREFDFLSLNCKDTILQNKAVRQALSYAIDKDNIISSVFNNQKIVSEYPLDYGNYLYSPNTVSSGYNLEQAKKVLEQDGWEYTNNTWKKEIDGYKRTLKLTISVKRDNDTRISVAEIIKQQLEKIGIPITIEKISNDKYGDYIENKNYQILFTGVHTSYSPDLTYYFANGNLENYSNDKMFELLEKATILKDEEKLKQEYSEIYSIYKEDIPFIGLYRNKNTTITSTDLVGTINSNNYSTFYGINNWYRR